MKRAALVFVLLFAAAPARAEEIAPFTASDRLLVVAPHPDDEALGAAGLIRRAKAAGAAVRVVYLTQGDDNELSSLFYFKKPLVTKSDTVRMGDLREGESQAAMRVLGVPGEDLLFLGYPDAGLLTIWRRHWGGSKPYRNLLTNINKVPYKDAYARGSFYRGDNVARDLRRAIGEFRPTRVVVPAPFDRHADHRAAYLFTQLALLELEKRIDPPLVYGYVVHARRWPRPRAYRPAEALWPPVAGLPAGTPAWIPFPLTAAETALKKKAISEYGSQLTYTKKFLLSFVRTNEIFLPLSRERLSAAPPAGGTAPLSRASGPPSAVYFLKDGELWIDVRFGDAVDEMGGMGVELYPYRADRSFAEMPKLSLRFFGKRFSASDASGRVRNAEIFFRASAGRYQIRVPLSLLGGPDRLFVSASTAKSEPDLDSWKLLEIA